MKLLERWLLKRWIGRWEETMDRFLKKLKGKKTYLIAISTAVYAIAGAVAGLHDWKYAVELILGASGLSTLRAGIAKR